MKKAKTKKPPTKWSNTFIYRAYELARSGHSDGDIAKLLGISAPTFASWRAKRPSFRKAIEEARALIDDRTGEQLKEYIYNRLPEQLQDLWDEIDRLERVDNGIQRIEALLKDRGIRARQHIFLHALVHFAFDPSQACRKVNISLGTLKVWINSDPDFAALVDEIHEHKKYFYVSCLNQRCLAGDTAAIIFANKTINRDLGYNEQTDVNITGQVNQNLTFSLQELKEIPLKERVAILAAIRKQKQDAETNVLEAAPPAIAAG